jgi:hypothetical protein
MVSPIPDKFGNQLLGINGIWISVGALGITITGTPRSSYFFMKSAF